MNYIKILRPINLLIVALTQYCIFYLLLSPIFTQYPLPEAVLSNGLIHLFVITTLCITAGGFIINDIVDYDIDIVNKPDKIFIGEDKINFKSANLYYLFVNGIGMIISLYIGYQADKLPLVVIYPISVGLLYLYSTTFKGKMLIGNLIVALFSMFVSGVIFFAEWSNISSLTLHSQKDYNLVFEVAMSYMLFGFFSSMYREIIKDIEDYDGDKSQGLSTLPIVVGIKNAKVIAISMITALLMSYHKWYRMFDHTDHKTLYTATLIALMVIPTVFILLKTVKATQKEEFSKLSTWTKGLMLASIILFIIICVMH